MQWILFKLLYNFLRTCLLLYFFNSRLNFKSIHRKSIFAFAAIHWAVMSLDLFLPISIPVELNFLLFIPYALLTVRDKWYISAFWLAIYIILYFAALDISYFVLNSISGFAAWKIISSPLGFKIIFLTLFTLLLSLLLLIVSRFKKEYSRLSWSNLFLFMGSLLVIFAVEKTVYHIQNSHEAHLLMPNTLWFMLVYVGLCVCLLITVILFQRMSSIFEMEMNHQAELDAISLKKMHQQELERLYDQLSIRQHDFKQHMQTLAEMVKTGGSETAEAYLKSYQAEIANDVVFSTGSPAADALLTAKYLTMKKTGIEFRYSLYPFDKLPIPITQFCTLLGNLLDNAIEGIRRLDEPEGSIVHLRLLRLGDMMCILCSNPCNPGTLQQTPTGWLTSKKHRSDGTTHSIGIRTIRRIVSEADGRCDFNAEKDLFTVKILLPFPA